MATHRIVCTEQEPVYLPTTHAHIVAVGTGTNPSSASQRWTLQQVLNALDAGHRFYTEANGKRAMVRAVYCQHCRRRIIRSAPDATTANNLDSLRRCAWKS